MLNTDFRDMLSALLDAHAEFLLVGAYALAVHGVPRATGDMDLLLRPSSENAARVMTALQHFGAPLFDLSQDDLQQPDTVFQIGLAPRRIDLLTSIDGVDFEEAWRERIETTVEGLVIQVIGQQHLIQNKRAVGRPKDMADVAWLEAEREEP